jgi:protein brassinosteroid insensitive 1
MDSLMRLLIAAALLVAAAAVAALADDAQLLDEFKAAVPNQASLEGWTARDGACRFPGAACRGGRLTSLSLAAVPLNADFRAVAATLLQLSAVEKLSLRGANVSGALAAAAGARCGSKLEELDLSGNAALRGSVADAAALAGSCGGLKTLNLSGGAVGAAKAGGGGGGVQGFAALDALDLSNNKIAGDADFRWMVGAGVGGGPGRGRPPL